jgi:hypothetical protein
MPKLNPSADELKLREVKRLIDHAMVASRTLSLPELLPLLGAASLAVSDELAANGNGRVSQPVRSQPMENNRKTRSQAMRSASN